MCNRIKEDARTLGQTLKLVGVTREQFRDRIAEKFRPGMSWESYGDTWTLDHIRPCNTFDLENPAQRVLCHSWMNLQPLPAQENLAKAGRWSSELEEAWGERLRRLGYEGPLFPLYTDLVT